MSCADDMNYELPSLMCDWLSHHYQLDMADDAVTLCCGHSNSVRETASSTVFSRMLKGLKHFQ